MKKLVLLIFIPLFISCGNNLSRSEAEKLINNNSLFQEIGKSPKLNNNAFDNGINQGYWDNNRYLTSKGYNFFINISYNKLTLIAQLECKVKSIDGIADVNSYSSGSKESSYKEVQFTWEFFNVNSVVKRFILKGGKGVAFFRKFDDGWRIDNISVDYSDLFFNINESDEKEIQNDIELENQRRLAEQKRLDEEKAKQKEEENKLTELISKSQIINKTIGSYNTVNDFTGKELNKKVTLTDVHLFRDISGNQYLNIWFGSINSKPSAHRFRQSAMGWDGFAIKIDSKQILFKNEHEATKFYSDLISAIEKWNDKYPELKKW